MLTLHRRMFGDVWTWAGTQRGRVTNIGVEPRLIATQSRLTFDDAKYWHTQEVFGPDERAARIHCRLVSVHPFRNGNGRCTRMMADLYLFCIGAEPFGHFDASWHHANRHITQPNVLAGALASSFAPVALPTRNA
jgi:fido (protein-threonine AMPylation protein)